MYGLRVTVTRRVDRRGSEVLHLDSEFGKPREIPSWMADAAACASMTVGSSQASVEALVELRELLALTAKSDSVSESSAMAEHNDENDDPRSVQAMEPGTDAPTADTTQRGRSKSAQTDTGGTADRGARKRVRKATRRPGGKR